MYAQFAATVGAIMAMIACAGSVFAWWRISGLVRTVRSTISMQGELHEIRDYMAKLDAWSKRINARLVMEERREGARTADSSPSTSKDARTDLLRTSRDKGELRRLAGLVPGRPAPHS